MNKKLFALLILLFPLHILSETNEDIDEKCSSSLDNPICINLNESQKDIQPLTKEDNNNTIPIKNEFNSLSQYGIVDYASAVKWCRKKISENYDYGVQIERLDIHPADFCRTYFNPSIQSKNRRICIECDLDPNLILANLFEAIKVQHNLYDSDKDISEEFNTGEENIPPTIITEKNKSIPDQAKEDSKGISDQPLGNSKSAYLTTSIGSSKISDIDVKDINSDIEFDTGLGIDVGIGYDFGQNRLEASWVRGQSEEVSWLGYSIESDSKIDSIIFSYYYDFRDNKKWSPVIGASIGSINVDINGVEDTGLTYGLGYGLSYKKSAIMDIFIKGQTMFVPELNFGTISIENAYYSNATVGIRYRF